MTELILTVGVYGFSEAAFYEALVQHRVDALIDVRQRRGVRGAQFAFGNARRLEDGLAKRKIQYLHLIDLAPTTDIRNLQRRVDARERTPKRGRHVLGPEFVSAYRSQILTPDRLERAVTELGMLNRPALLCVERAADACHRSLAAAELAIALDVPVEHVHP